MGAARSAIMLVLGLCTSVSMGQGGATAYDGCAGPAGADLGGWAGGDGWTGPWADFGMGIPTVFTGPAGGLMFGDLSTTPGAARTAGGWLPDMTGYARAYPQIAGDLMYVSCLLRPEADQSYWYTLRLGQYPRQVDIGVPIGSASYGMMLGDGLIVDTPVPTIVGRTTFLVLEVVHERAANRTVYSLYVDAPPGAEKPPWPMATYTRPGLLSFGTTLELRGEGGYSLDEMRIGETWASVTPVGPACIADLNGDGLVDFADYLEFLNLYDVQDARVDFTDDGLVDFSDYLEFLNLYEVGC